MGKIISIYHLHLKLRRVKTMREEPSTTKKLSSRYQKCVSSGFTRERCKRKHDFIKRAWNERSCSIYHGIGDEMEQSERQKQPLALQSRENGKRKQTKTSSNYRKRNHESHRFKNAKV